MKRTLILTAWAVTVACGSNSGTGPGDRVELNQPFALDFGDSVVLAENGLALTFGAVTDSRCPDGVVCVWEGDGEATIEIRLTGEEPREVVLHTNPRFPTTADVDSFIVELVALDPFPIHEQPVRDDEYVATLVVHRSTDEAD